MFNLPTSLTPWAAFRRFLICEFVPLPSGKTDKVPLLPSLQGPHGRPFERGDAHDAATQLSLLEAQAWLEVAQQTFPARQFGVGFAFNQADGWWFLDIDHCIVDGAWSPVALQMMLEAFPRSPVELSHSGQGLHIFGRGVPPVHSTKNGQWGLELYHKDRFVALTGRMVREGDLCADSSANLNWLVSTYFQPKVAGDTVDWQEGPDPEWHGEPDDDRLIEWACRLPPGTWGSVPFGALWMADVSVLSQAYPDAQRDFDHSRADLALATELAKMTGYDGPRIERLMRRSALARDKWDHHGSYLRELTIGRGVGAAREAAARARAAGNVPWPRQAWAPVQVAPAAPATAGVVPEPPVAGQWVDPTYRYAVGSFVPYGQLPDYCQGYSYVHEREEVIDPEGRAYSHAQFKNWHLGRAWGKDPTNAATRDAWEAAVPFSQRYDRTVEWYDEPFMREVRFDDRRCLNIGKLPDVATRPATREQKRTFMRHLQWLFPNRDARRILLAHMTRAVQRRGHRIGWAPVIQGAEGTGKSLVVNLLEYAVGHSKCVLVNTPQIAKNGQIGFNADMEGALLAIMNESKLADARDVLEVLKPFLTDDHIRVEGKGIASKRVRNFMNWIAVTNHKTGVPIEEGGRRWAPLYTAQQPDSKFNTAVPSAFWKWCQDSANREAVAHFLGTLQVVRAPACDPTADYTRAPVTPDTDEAIRESLGAWEQEIQEAIDSGVDGFKGGVISSLCVMKLIPRLKTRALKATMARLGYVPHPALPDGRVNTVLDLSKSLADHQRKPRLYVHRSNVAVLAISDPAEVSRAYVKIWNDQPVLTMVPPPPQLGGHSG
jgi:hypothetical protein